MCRVAMQCLRFRCLINNRMCTGRVHFPIVFKAYETKSGIRSQVLGNRENRSEHALQYYYSTKRKLFGAHRNCEGEEERNRRWSATNHFFQEEKTTRTPKTRHGTDNKYSNTTIFFASPFILFHKKQSSGVLLLLYLFHHYALYTVIKKRSVLYEIYNNYNHIFLKE